MTRTEQYQKGGPPQFTTFCNLLRRCDKLPALLIYSSVRIFSSGIKGQKLYVEVEKSSMV